MPWVLAASLPACAPNAVWRTEETLWRDVTEKSPTNGRGLMNYGVDRMAHGDFPTAIRYFERALAFTPNYEVLHVNLGVAYGSMRRAEDAERSFQRALSLAPTDWRSHLYFARWLNTVGRIDEARAEAMMAAAQNPADEASRRLAARCRRPPTTARRLHRPVARAVRTGVPRVDPERKGSVRLKPDSAEAYNNVAAGHNALGEWTRHRGGPAGGGRQAGARDRANNLAYAIAQKQKGRGGPSRRRRQVSEPLALLVPAHHPAQQLSDLVQRMLGAEVALFRAAIVVDDGNEAEWRPLFDAVARVPRAVVVRRETRGGKGAALKTGIAHALEAWPDIAGVVTADADGQHAPADVARVGRALAAAPGHLVLGRADSTARCRAGACRQRNHAPSSVDHGVALWTPRPAGGWPRDSPAELQAGRRLRVEPRRCRERGRARLEVRSQHLEDGMREHFRRPGPIRIYGVPHDTRSQTIVGC